MRFELMTSFLPRKRSTPELQRPIAMFCDHPVRVKSGPGRTRTYEGFRQRVYSPPPLPLGTLTLTLVLVLLVVKSLRWDLNP
jgi:hypothetical protein